MKQYDVVALGELLVDFVQCGKSDQGHVVYEANPGGAPCNVLAMLSKLGHRTAFIGKVGNDSFGYMLRDAVQAQGIDTCGLCYDDRIHTTLAFVHRKADGDRAFSFCRNPGADMMLQEGEVPEGLIRHARVFHYGSISMTSEDAFRATATAISMAERHGVLRSFDPNLRESLWENLSTAKEKIRYGLAHCDVLKISDNEIEWLTGETDYTRGVLAIRREFDIPLILVSMGKVGSRAYYRDMIAEAAAFTTAMTIETTGAGDTFCACVLHGVLANDLDNLNERILLDILQFANAAASLVTTRKGALSVMPCEEEVFAILA